MRAKKFYGIILKIIYCLLSLLFFIPYINFICKTQRLAGYVYYLVILAATLTALLYSAANRKRKIDINGIDAALLLFVIYLTVRLFIREPDLLLNDRYLSFPALLITYFLFKLFRGSFFIMLLVFSGLLQNALCFLQLSGILANSNPHFLIGGSFGNPGVYAGYITPLIALAIGFLVRINKLRQTPYLTLCRCLCIIFLASSAYLIPLSGSRSAWIGIICSCAFMFYHYRKDKIRNMLSIGRITLANTLLILSLILCLTGGAASMLFLYKKDSVAGRVLVWRVSTAMIKQHPVFGIGLGGFASSYNDFQERYFAQNTDPTPQELAVADNTFTAFNEFLEMLIEEGIAGLLLFGLFIILLLRSAQFKTFAVAAQASVISLLLLALSSYPLHVLPVLFNFFFVSAIISSRIRSSGRRSSFIRSSSLIPSKTLLHLSAALCLPLIAYDIVELRAVRRLEELTAIVNQADPGYSIQVLKDISPLLNYDEEYLLCKSIALFRAGEFYGSTQTLEQLKGRVSTNEFYMLLGNGYKALRNYDKAEACYAYAAHMVPNRFLPEYLLMRLYAETGRATDAVKKGFYILTMPEKIPSARVQQIKSDVQDFIRRQPGGIYQSGSNHQ